ncbi:MAG TPA: hypothetical protein VM911_08130 [Pyrinomonadaceae bacterium]|jgi:hypothetical protein|nr:hypothetical protein [Pyrinomonadaceae bacterium]
MSAQVKNYFGENVIWRKGTNPEYPYVTDFEGKKCLIRLNNFPKENLYTLIVDGVEIADFDDWPDSFALERSIKMQGVRDHELEQTGQRTEEIVLESPNSNVIWWSRAQVLQREAEAAQRELQRTEVQWREYETHVDLYKYYLDLGLKTNAFFYVLTGVIVGFYLKNTDVQYIKISLLLPIAISIALGSVFIYGAMLWRKVTRNIKTIIEDLNHSELKIRQTPDIHLLSLLLLLFGFLFLIVGVSLGVLWILT